VREAGRRGEFGGVDAFQTQRKSSFAMIERCTSVAPS
jgi:hypothetical protein